MWLTIWWSFEGMHDENMHMHMRICFWSCQKRFLTIVEYNRGSLLGDRIYLYRSNRSEVFSKKGVLKNFVKFRGKYQYQSLFFNKIAGLRLKAVNYFHKKLHHRCLIYIHLCDRDRPRSSDVFMIFVNTIWNY